MKNNTLFWIGWAIWIVMVVVKAVVVFMGGEFQWDPMFLMVPFSFIIIGAYPEHKCNCNKSENEKEDKE